MDFKKNAAGGYGFKSIQGVSQGNHVLHVIMDFGANVTLTGGVCLQTKEGSLTLIQYISG